MLYAECSRLASLARKLVRFIVCKSGIAWFLAAMLALPLYPQAAMAADGNHSCAVQHGGVQCWGSGSSGQLGNGSWTFKSNTPVTAIGMLGGASAVSVGYWHSCAAANGGVLCWGINSSNQLGDGSNSNSNTPVSTIPPGSGTSAVAAGRYHSCAAVSGGVQCWGLNSSGQLGNGNNTNSNIPVAAIAANSGASDVAAGKLHSCAVVNGGVQCWGANSNGQLGNGNNTDSNIPVSAIAANSGVTAVAASNNFSCAVANGGLKCWGLNSVVNSSTPADVLAANSGVSAAAVGFDHVCAVVNGGVQCWGSNSNGQFGDGSITSGATAIMAGASHTCATVNGGVQCWGWNFYGQLGDGSYTQSSTPVTALAAPAAATPTTYMHSGQPFTNVIAPYTTHDSVHGYITTNGPLAANLSMSDIRAQVLSYSFSDGQQTLDNTNSVICDVSYRSRGLYVSTDVGGAITDWGIWVCTPTTLNGSFNSISSTHDSVNSSYAEQAYQGGTCTAINAHSCTSATLIGGVTPEGDVSGASPWIATSYTAPTATNTGNATVSLSGGGSACGFNGAPYFISPPAQPPTGVTLPHGLLSFNLGNCTAGGTVTLSVTYPSAVPAGTQYWKYGQTSTDHSNHWYTIPASISGNTVTFTITDGGLGDDDLAANGAIADAGGIGVTAATGATAAIPTLSEWGVILLAGLLGVLGISLIRRIGVA